MMNDVVRLLPDSVANQIAAGEVIQRPASVVKELVENSVDAGATSIKLIIKDAGRTLIEVIDNGCGMSATDARLAFDRHSTSKINEAADLFDLHTMGFRGEALASICAVSEVELRTMRRGDAMGTRIVIAGSRVETQEPTACTPGSCMMVKRLFFNVPARRKFLKSDSVEMSHILREFERLALVNPSVEMELIHNDIVIHKLMRSSFKQRITALFGKALDHQLVPIESDTSMVRISGFVCRPENARRRGALQYFMVNGRNMRHPYFHKAVTMCYDQLIATDLQPSYFINFTVDPRTIDVNIHPTKNEIKFEHEQPIWQILTATIRESLGKFNAGPTIDFDRDDAPDIPAFQPDSSAPHGLDLDPTYNPFKQPTSRPSSGSSLWRNTMPEATRDWEKLYADFTGNATPEKIPVTPALDGLSSKPSALNSTEQAAQTDNPKPILQVKNRYIVTPTSSGLMVIDQHRAHVLVLYDRYLKAADEAPLSSQRVIFPEVVTLSPSDNAVMTGITAELPALGFEIDYLGDNSWAVNGMPAVMANVNPQELLPSMVSTVADTGEALADSLRSRIALAMARAAAVRSGQVLTDSEMNRLVADLTAMTAPGYTPDGKKTFSVIATDDLAKLLG